MRNVRYFDWTLATGFAVVSTCSFAPTSSRAPGRCKFVLLFVHLSIGLVVLLIQVRDTRSRGGSLFDGGPCGGTFLLVDPGECD